MRHVDHINLGVPLNYIGGLDTFWHTQFLSICDDFLGTIEALQVEATLIALVAVKLI